MPNVADRQRVRCREATFFAVCLEMPAHWKRRTASQWVRTEGTMSRGDQGGPVAMRRSVQQVPMAREASECTLKKGIAPRLPLLRDTPGQASWALSLSWERV